MEGCPVEAIGTMAWKHPPRPPRNHLRSRTCMTPALRARVLHEWRPLLRGCDARTQKPASSANQLVPLVMKQLGLEERLQQSQVFYLWPSIVGSDIARHAQPVSLRNGLLVVGCDHPMWLQEITRYSKPLIFKKCRSGSEKKLSATSLSHRLMFKTRHVFG